MPQLQREALLQIARADADRIEVLHHVQHVLDFRDRPVPHRRDLVDRRHQIAVVAEIADNRLADLADLVVVCRHRQLPFEMSGEGALRGERVLEGREFLDFDRRAAGAVAIVEVVAEEVGVVVVVPGVLTLGSAFPAASASPRSVWATASGT